MFRHYSLPVCLCLMAPLYLNAQVTKTELVDFPPGGVLRLNNSVGELTVEGWDRPEVEITTVKFARAYGSQARENERNADRIQIKTERRGNEVVVTTEFPRYAAFPPPVPLLRTGTHFDLEYRIRAPRTAGLVVNHDAGEVHITDLASDVHVKVLKGGITLRLTSGVPYQIDAKSDIGNVVSDFPGEDHRRLWLWGHRFAQKASPPGHQLYLRVGFGDIAILKIRKPPYALTDKAPTN